MQRAPCHVVAGTTGGCPRLVVRTCTAQTAYPSLHIAAARVPTPGQHGQLRLRTVTSSLKDGFSERSSEPQPSTSSSDEQDPKGSARRPAIIQLLKKIKLPQWLVQFARLYLFPRSDARTAAVARALWICMGFMLVAVGREMMMSPYKVTPRETYYSDFVTLLDAGRIRAARLESGTSRLYFDIKVTPTAEQLQAAQAANAAATAAAAGAVAATTAGEAAGSTASPQAAAASTSGSTAAAASQPAPRQRFMKQYYIKLSDKHDPALIGRIMQCGVEYSVLKASFQAALANVFLTAVALWLPLMPLLWILRRMVDQRQGSSRAKKSDSVTNPTTRFADVAGVDAAKQELMEVVSVMKQAKSSYTRLKVKMPSGVLLCGPPGTGKTLLAKAVAGEAGVPFIAVSASEFVELFVGRGAARIRELFAEARKAAPCVVFIDELDGLGSKRGMGFNDERDQTLNQLLTELDGFDGRPGVLFLAATNRIDVLDPALLRPGRISRKVLVPLPDTNGRAQIMGVHTRGVPLDEALEQEQACRIVAATTAGFSGAELANVVNEATLLASRRDAASISLDDLLDGVKRTRFGVDGRSGGSAYGNPLARWLLDQARSAGQPVKVSAGGA